MANKNEMKNKMKELNYNINESAKRSAYKTFLNILFFTIMATIVIILFLPFVVVYAITGGSGLDVLLCSGISFIIIILYFIFGSWANAYIHGRLLVYIYSMYLKDKHFEFSLTEETILSIIVGSLGLYSASANIRDAFDLDYQEYLNVQEFIKRFY